MRIPDDFKRDAGVLTHKSHDFDITFQPDLMNRRRKVIHVYRRGEPVRTSTGACKRFASRAHAIRFVRMTIEQEKHS